ncbi:MAG: hypothetical protein ABF904_09100 [Ethanoligenens sp.]
MNSNNQKLIAAEILLPSGETNLNKINLISGAITLPFVRMVYESNAGDVSGVQRMYNLLSGLFFSGQYQELYDSLKEVYDDMGYQFDSTVSLIQDNQDALVYFLESFLMDYEDIMEDYRIEKSAS